MALEVRPITFRAACDFVTALHRHHKAPRGHKFSIAAYADDVIVGVVCVGRPIARSFDDGLTAEVIRSCTTGYPNANSFLYAAARRAAFAMGYRRILTYTEAGESGASLKAAGWWKTKDLPARKNWAESSRKLQALRDPEGRGGVVRQRWEWKATA